MGRAKIEIKEIEDARKRRATFLKRQDGLLKKAFELSELCAADVGVIIFPSTGKVKLTHFCSDGKIEELITRFMNLTEEERAEGKFEDMECLNKEVPKLADGERVVIADQVPSLCQADQVDCEHGAIDEFQSVGLANQFELENAELKAKVQELSAQNYHLKRKQLSSTPESLYLKRQQLSCHSFDNDISAPIQDPSVIQDLEHRVVEIPKANEVVENVKQDLIHDALEIPKANEVVENVKQDLIHDALEIQEAKKFVENVILPDINHGALEILEAKEVVEKQDCFPERVVDLEEISADTLFSWDTPGFMAPRLFA